MKKLSKIIAKRFEDKLEEFFQREQIDPDFLSHDEFDSCFERAMTWIQMSFDEAKVGMATDAGFAIAVHRSGDDHNDESAEAEKVVLLESGADPTIGTLGFWNQ